MERVPTAFPTTGSAPMDQPLRPARPGLRLRSGARERLPDGPARIIEDIAVQNDGDLAALVTKYLRQPDVGGALRGMLQLG